MFRWLIVLVTLLLSACSTPYGEYGLLGGYRDSRIDDNTFSISVEANGYTSAQTASMQAMYRAAELTVQNGFDYFVIVNGARSSTTGAMVMPGSSTSHTTANVYGSTATARTTTTYSPTVAVPIVYPNESLVIKSFKGKKPEDAANAYDARSVMAYLGPQIGAAPQKR